MSKYHQISTELWPLIDVKKVFPLSNLHIFLPNFFKLCIRIDIGEWFGIVDYWNEKIIKEQSDQGSYCLLP